jgi:ribonucleoside-diphosphate reductase alpha chain
MGISGVEMQMLSLNDVHEQRGSLLPETPDKDAFKWPRPNRAGTWSEPALRVLNERYLLRVAGKVVETPDEMCWRVACAIAVAERKWGGEETVAEVAEQFYDLLIERKFLPNSPTLMNAGKGTGLQYSACFVLPVPDSIDGIFETIKNAAIIHKSGGGTGFSFSRLRPKDSLVSTSGGRASGPVSFLRVFNAATEAVKQGGTRRGANMGILQVDHPDILEFIDCKNDGGITNFNISVAITEPFMRALETDSEYDLIDPHTGQVTGRLRAREVWERIVDSAWRTGDPGLVFIDRINASRANPVPELERIEATNPCGEQPLAPNDACNLGSINLAQMLKPGTREIDWEELDRVTRLSVRFLDDVIEVNPYPLPEIMAEVHANRRIGLGIMGWADLLFQLGIPYDSEEALQLAERIMSRIEHVGHQMSQELATQRGPFPNWSRSIYKDGPPLRNATVTTIAPTGTISIIADTSSGIEPIFALAFYHKVGERKLTFVNPYVKEALRERGLASDELMEEICRRGTLHGIDGVPDDLKRVFVTAHEIPYEWHVRMQAAFQKYTDNGVSKTINLPNEATREDIERAYALAYELGCLGITVFRDGCKGTQVLNVGVEEKREQRATQAMLPGLATIKPRPRVAQGATHRIETPVGTAFITINHDENGDPLEVFVNIGRAGSDILAVAEAMGRLISLTLRMPSPLTQEEKLEQIVDQLRGIAGSRSLGFGANRVLSLPDAISQVLAEYTNGTRAQRETAGTMPDLFSSQLPVQGDLCPKCGWAAFVHEEGCKKCHFCGYSEC